MSIPVEISPADTPPRRQAPRYAVDASITINRSDGESAIIGRCINLSASGLCAELAGAVPPGIAVTLALTLEFDQGDFSEPLPLPARSVWCTHLGDESYQLGFQFTALNPQQSGFLKLFVRYLKS